MRPIPGTITDPAIDVLLRPVARNTSTNGTEPGRDRLESRLSDLETKYAYLNAYVSKLDRQVARLVSVRK